MTAPGDHSIQRAIQVAAGDTVAVATVDLPAGEAVDLGGVVVKLRDPIRKGHKFAAAPMQAGAQVIKYGFPIGRATTAIASGDHVHEHNLATSLRPGEDYIPPEHFPEFGPSAQSSARFMGVRRADGRVGTRNEIWIVATVGCVANVCEAIARMARPAVDGLVDGVVAITHPFGCSQLGGDLDGTRDILARLAEHPNVGGVLLVGLGCESNQLDALRAAADRLDPARVRMVRSQSVEDELAAGVAAVQELAAVAAGDQREPCDLEDLVIGLKCGGSDGFSGLTANPLLGRACDTVTSAGGSAILTEIPEIFGAEHLLLERSRDRSVFDALAGAVNRFKRYFVEHGEPVSENPSPGNRAGGITTLEEKSLGAVQKAGSAVVCDVISYGEAIRQRGLTILEAPGNDAVSSTALAAAGATLILFTTGRGTPLGFPAPTIKIASNSDLASRKRNWIDFDAGAAIGGTPQAELDAAFLAFLMDIASGRQTSAERNGERSIAIWKRGVTL